MVEQVPRAYRGDDYFYLENIILSPREVDDDGLERLMANVSKSNVEGI